MKIYITAFGYINSAGFGDHATGRSWAEIGVESFAQCQWKQLFDSPFDRFGRLDTFSKHVVASVELLGLPLPDGDIKEDETALYVGTEFGSCQVDKQFYRSLTQPGGASPKLFSYTLPSTAIGEVAIRHKINGPNLCVSAGQSSGLVALWQSAELLKSHEVARCITIIGDAGSTEPDSCAPPESSSYAILLNTVMPADSSKVILTLDFDENEDSSSAGTDIQKLYEYIKVPQSEPLYLGPPNGFDTNKRLIIEHQKSNPLE